jgi:LuxR family transcriptional regulator, maltose regulon positive regulatory protein
MRAGRLAWTVGRMSIPVTPIRDLGRREGWSDEPVTSIAYVALGITRVWQGRIEEAEAWLDLAERALRLEVQPVAGTLLPDGLLLPFLLHYAAGLLQRQRRPSRQRRPGPPHHPDDLLTDSETRVLRYLPTRLTAQEIARQLSLSVHTVTTHTRHIYAKLGVHRRHEAVERARARGLLAPIPGLTSVHST